MAWIAVCVCVCACRGEGVDGCGVGRVSKVKKHVVGEGKGLFCVCPYGRGSQSWIGATRSDRESNNEERNGRRRAHTGERACRFLGPFPNWIDALAKTRIDPSKKRIETNKQAASQKKNRTQTRTIWYCGATQTEHQKENPVPCAAMRRMPWEDRSAGGPSGATTCGGPEQKLPTAPANEFLNENSVASLTHTGASFGGRLVVSVGKFL